MTSTSSNPVVLTGSCCCNKIRFSSTTLPESASNCCCVQCRKIAGSQYLTFARFRRSSVTWLTEPPKYYRYSQAAKRGYCEACGSTMTFEADEEPENISICPSAFDDSEVKGDLVKPDRYTYVEEKPDWYEIPNDGLPRFIGEGPTEA